jgi:hypothetical protein
MISRWIGDQKVKCIVSDKESKSGKVIRDCGWDVIQIVDPNHCIKAFTRKWDGLTRIQKQHLHGLKERLMTLLRTLIPQPMTVEGKPPMWQNAINHHLGDYTRFPFPQHRGYIWRPKDGDAALRTLIFVISAAEDLVQN